MFKFLKKQKKSSDINEDYQSFGKGRVLPLEEVPDRAFSEKMIGDGYALELSEGKIVAPISGEVVLVFPTGHAFGIKDQHGVEILLHLGIDTVSLNGVGFTSKVVLGQFVKQGDVLSYMDLEAIKRAGKSIISLFIVTSGHEVTLHKAHEEVDFFTQGIVSIEY